MMIDVNHLIARLDAGKLGWRDLDQAERRAIVSHYLYRLQPHYDTLTYAQFLRETPDWMPRSAKWVSAPFIEQYADWRALIIAHGIEPDARYSRERNTERHLCECGQPATSAVPVQIGSGTGHINTVKLLLCVDCLKEHLELEGKTR